MTQLIVSLEENTTLIEDIKRAIKMLRGVTSVRETQSTPTYNAQTIKAFQELEEGNTVVCDSYEDYKNLINETLQD